MKHPSKKIVWAIDAFDTEKKIHKSAARLIRKFQRQTDTLTVQPVFILNVSQLLGSTQGPKLLMDRYRDAAIRTVGEIVSQLQLSQVNDPHVILQERPSPHETETLLSEYAQEVNADVILVSSHGRSGVSRFLFGSVSESLILRSAVPVIAIGPRIKSKGGTIRKIICPIDFGPHSKKIFRHVVGLAQRFNAKLILFHVVPLPIEPIFQSGVYLLGGVWMPVQNYFGLQVEKRSKRLEAWARWARNRGVSASSKIQSLGGTVSSRISTLARRKKADLIVMEEQSGPVSATLIGSVTRQVIRESPCPVWVYRESMIPSGSLIHGSGSFQPRAA